MKFDFDLLKKISETPGAPGYEKPIRDVVHALVKSHVDEIYTDHLGNIITVKKGVDNPEGKKIMLAAHLDEIGFMVNHIDDNGFLRFVPLGGFDPKTLTSMRVLVHGKESVMGVMGCKPIHMMSPAEREKGVKLDDFYIDLGLPKEEVEKLVETGNAVTRYQPLEMLGELVNGKSLDNRVSVYILLELLKTLENTPYDVYGVFTVQEEVGIRGASVAAHQINPDFAIAIDVTIASDTPGTSPEKQISKIGKGAAIKVYDSSTICDYRMVAYLKKIANQFAIPWQAEILPFGGTDTAGMQKMGKNGAIAGAVSIPTRYIHQTIETAHPNDILATINLLKVAVENLDSYDWVH